MTDREALFLYRLKQAEETLLDAEKMLSDNLSPRSITNGAYYVSCPDYFTQDEVESSPE